MHKIICGDALTTLRQMHDNCVHCVVTSPPYFGLRDYGTAKWEGGDPACDHKQGRPGAGRADGLVDDRAQRNRDGVGSMGGDCKKCGAARIDSQIGLEQSPANYVAKLVDVFREVRRVLRPDGTLWLNLGDSYTRSPAKGGSGPNGKNEDRWGYGAANKQRVVDPNSKQATNRSAHLDGIARHTTIGSSDGAVGRADRPGSRAADESLAAKQLLGIPWRVAFALQADGWYLRQDIIWHKPNPMPESVRDRCTKAHEYLFLLTKSERYFFDVDAIKETAVGGTPGNKTHKGKTAWEAGDKFQRTKVGLTEMGPVEFRNKRSVWTITTKPYKEAHFATFPPDLVEPCIKAGSPENGIVMDIFGGAGTTGLVAKNLNRHCVLIELNPDYVKLIEKRLA